MLEIEERRGKKRKDQVMNIERKGIKEGENRREKNRENSMIYRVIHLLTHNKINILNWRIGFL